MPKRSDKYNLVIIPSLLLLHLAGTMFAKYFINDLPITSFRITYLGNIFNILLTGLIILGYVIYGIINSGYDKRERNLIVLFTLIILLPLIPLVILNSTKLPFEGDYFLGVPIKKLYLGLLFFLEIFFQLYLLFIVWGFIIDRKFFSYIRSVYISAVAILFLLMFAFLYNVDFSEKLTDPEIKMYEVAVIPGAAVWRYDKPSPIFEGRIRRAYDLYKNGLVGKIQLTGGNAPGEKSEAETAHSYLRELGVKDEDIIIEKSTSTTTEQISFIKKELILSHHYKNIVIISDGFHLTRILEICKFFNIEAVAVPSDYEIKWDKLLYYKARESVALLMFWFYAI